MAFFYWFFVFIVGIAMRLYYKIEVEGRSNIPKKGPFILICNHAFLADPVLLAVTFPRIIRFMAKEEIFKNPLAALFFKSVGVFAVKRGTGDNKSIQTAMNTLHKGGIFGIFPEGTRNFGGATHRPKAGAAYMALQAGVDVLPAAIVYENGTKFRSKVTIQYGNPIPKQVLKELPPNKTGLLAANDLLFGEVRALLGEVEV